MEAVAKYDYEATADDELSFKKGEPMKVLQATGNWYKAEVRGAEGFVPKNFIDIHLPSWYQEDASRAEAQERLMSQPAGAFLIRGSRNTALGSFSISVRHTRDVQHFKVLRDERGQYRVWSEKFVSLNQLVEYYKNNSVSKRNQIFLQESQQPSHQPRGSSDDLPPPPASLPAPPRPSYTPTPAPRQPRGNSDSLPSLPGSLPLPPRSSYTAAPTPSPRQHKAPSMLQVIALYSFRAEETDELEFDSGDIIRVLDCPDKSWWRGLLKGKTGLFPSNYTKPI